MSDKILELPWERQGWLMERVASEHVSETTVTSVPLPTDEMKGRIIGRQGRNIRAIEAATGVDLVVDDTPEAVIVSSFDPTRRLWLEQGWIYAITPTCAAAASSAGRGITRGA